MKVYYALIFLLLLSCAQLELGKRQHSSRAISALDRGTCVDLVAGLIELSDFTTPEAKRILDEMVALHPDLSEKFLKQKLSAIEDEFMFYRSFVPYFYKKLNSKTSTLKIPSSLQGIKGKALGDLHMDNFGPLIRSQGDVFYGANDPDYANKVPLYSDVLRYFTGIFLNNKNMKKDKFNKLVEAYRAGLQADDSKLKIPKLVKEFSIEKLNYPVDEVDQSGKLVREIKKLRIPKELQGHERNEYRSLIEAKLGSSVEVLDSFKFLNVTGGSGGYMRFRFLVETNLGTDFLPSKQIIELKEIPENMKLPTSDGIINMDETLETFYQLEDPILKKFYGVLNGEETNFSMRPRWEQLDLTSASRMTGKEKQKILEYQSYLIGRYHRDSLVNSSFLESYLEELAKLKNKDWRSWAKQMAEFIGQDFEHVN